MRSFEELLTIYEASHRHPRNRVLHKVGIPLIALGLLSILWTLRLGFDSNGALLALLPLLGYYALFGWRSLALASLVWCLVLAVVIGLSESMSQPSLRILGAGAFVLGWVLQFIGHKCEGRKPAFFNDLQFLLVGPVWSMPTFIKALIFKPNSK